MEILFFYQAETLQPTNTEVLYVLIYFFVMFIFSKCDFLIGSIISLIIKTIYYKIIFDNAFKTSEI